MTNKRYFKREWEEEYYIFDSTEISEEKVDEEIEYGYEIFADSMQGDKVVNKLNEQEELIKRLKQIREEQTETILKQKRKIKELETRNKRQYNRLKEITDLMTKRDWETLENMVDDWEKADELLKQEWGTIL